MYGFLKRGVVVLVVALSGADAHGQMQLSGDGRGEVLLFPFYSAASGEETSFVIHNHESHAKALYLRFREGLSGAEVLSFNLYLGPNDSFEGAIIKDSNGDGAAIATLDSSCTVPTLGTPNGAFSGITSTQSDGRIFRSQPFVNYQYTSSRSDLPVTKDSNTDIRRTLVGSLEVIEMSQWGSGQSSGFSASADVFEDIESGDCDALNSRWSLSGEWVDNPRARASDWTGGGVSGELLITTPRGQLAYQPLVVENFAREKLAGEYHVSPGKWEGPWPSPSLANGSLSVISPAGGNLVAATSGLDAVATLLATTEVGVGSSDGSVSSDRAVVVSFPTKWHHTNLEFISDSGGVASVGEPFRADWDPSTSTACEAVGFARGAVTAGSFPFQGIASQQLCGAINLLNYPSSKGALAPEADWLAIGVPAIGEYPWAMSFADAAWDASYADERWINVNGDQGFLGMPALVMPLALSTEGNWIKESDVSRRIKVRSITGSDDNSGTDSGSNGGEDGRYDSFCAAGRNPAFGANPVKFDEVCNPDGTVKDGVDNNPSGGGFTPGGDSARPDDNCGSQGYDPTCTAGGAGNSADTAVPFPQGAQRVVQTVRVGSEILDFGSADRDAVFSVSRLFDVAKGKVSAIDFTLAPETSLTEYCANGAEVAPKFAGEWSDRCKDDKTPKTVADFCADGPDNSPSFFGDWSNSCEEDGTPKPNATPPLYERLDPNTFKLTLAESGITAGGNVHLWISTQRDGERVSEDCSSIPRFPEGPVIRAGVGDDSGSACRLEAGEKYYLMVAFCTAPEGVDDYNCTNPNTQTALRTVKVYTPPGWRRIVAQN